MFGCESGGCGCWGCGCCEPWPFGPYISPFISPGPSYSRSPICCPILEPILDDNIAGPPGMPGPMGGTEVAEEERAVAIPV